MTIFADGFLRELRPAGFGHGHYVIVGYDVEEDKIVVAETNPTNQVARKNGKRFKKRYTKDMVVMNIKVEGKEMLGQSSWNALYKGLSKMEVLEYLKPAQEISEIEIQKAKIEKMEIDLKLERAKLEEMKNPKHDVNDFIKTRNAQHMAQVNANR